MPPTSVAQQQFAASQALAMSPVMPPPPPEAHAVQPNLPTNPRKRRASGQPSALGPTPALGQGPIMPAQLQVGAVPVPPFADLVPSHEGVQTAVGLEQPPATPQPPAKKGRTNIPWTPTEEQRLKQIRDQGKSWSEIAKTFPNRTEGSVTKLCYKVRVLQAVVPQSDATAGHALCRVRHRGGSRAPQRHEGVRVQQVEVHRRQAEQAGQGKATSRRRWC